MEAKTLNCTRCDEAGAEALAAKFRVCLNGRPAGIVEARVRENSRGRTYRKALYRLRRTLDYAFNQDWSTSIGYRHLAVDYRRGGFVYDTSLSGPIASVSYRS